MRTNVPPLHQFIIPKRTVPSPADHGCFPTDPALRLRLRAGLWYSAPTALEFQRSQSSGVIGRRFSRRHLMAIAVLIFLLWATLSFASNSPAEQICPRAAPGSTVQNPPELRSQNGVLEVTLHFRYQATTVGQGPPRYCYITDDGVESPTLRRASRRSVDSSSAQRPSGGDPVASSPAGDARPARRTDGLRRDHDGWRDDQPAFSRLNDPA